MANGARVAVLQSVKRALDVLFCFDRDNPVLTAAEVAERMDLNRTTAWRYLQTLSAGGLTRELERQGHFALGGRCLLLADAYAGQWGGLAELAEPVLVDLRDAVEETAALHVRQGLSRVVLRQVESRQELHRTYRDLGEPIALSAGAPSLAILGALPREDREAYVGAHVPEADRAPLRAALRRLAECGYALSHGSRVPGIASVAVPLRDARGGALGAVNVTGPAHRFPDEAVPGLAGAVRRAADRIERRVGEAGLTAPP